MIVAILAASLNLQSARADQRDDVRIAEQREAILEFIGSNSVFTDLVGFDDLANSLRAPR